MKKITAALTLLTLFAGAVVAPVQSAQAEGQAVAVRNFDVFVDPPTGYTFVRLPSGWKFVGVVEQSDLGNLPATVITSLLPGKIEDLDREGIKAAQADASR